MATKDEEVYGLSREDCVETIGLLGAKERPIPGLPQPEQPRIYFGKSASLIGPGASGDVTIWEFEGTPAATSKVVNALMIATGQSSISNYLGICREDESGKWIVFFEVCGDS